MESKHVIIVAGGSGTRMRSELPKQFLPLAGFPLLMHTIRKFRASASQPECLLVLPPRYFDHWNALCVQHNFPGTQLINGGATRYHSVKNALKALPEDGLIAVHDGVRPLLSTKLIDLVFSEAGKCGSAVPVVSIKESLRLIQDGKSVAADRSQYRIVQTPQCFRATLLHKAYQKEYQDAYTDDASLVESLGETIHLVAGEENNIKITTPTDLVLAEHLIANRGV